MATAASNSTRSRPYRLSTASPASLSVFLASSSGTAVLNVNRMLVVGLLGSMVCTS